MENIDTRSRNYDKVSNLHRQQSIRWRFVACLLLGSVCGIEITVYAEMQPLLSNTSFESGNAYWNPTGSFTIGALSNPHTGSYYAYVTGNSQAGTMYQQFTIPSNATNALLHYYYSISTTETGSTPFDFLNITLRDSSGNILEVIAVYSNVDTTGGSYVYEVLNIGAYAGQTLRLHFDGTTDAFNLTTFRIDDVDVVATIPPPPTVRTDSATNIFTTGARLNATITDTGGASIIERRFSWGSTSSCSDGYTNAVTVNGSSFYFDLAEVPSGSTYYFRFP
ncbi:MAG: hypothetical protein NTX50_32820 [Candidatus Sumerlaeota bacterium]|nr:hypothetical protein [Candidatus Sumerlaeota bacterium]